MELEIDKSTLTSAFNDSGKIEQLNPGSFIFENAWYGLPLAHQPHETPVSLQKRTVRVVNSYAAASDVVCVHLFSSVL